MPIISAKHALIHVHQCELGYSLKKKYAKLREKHFLPIRIVLYAFAYSDRLEMQNKGFQCLMFRFGRILSFKVLFVDLHFGRSLLPMLNPYLSDNFILPLESHGITTVAMICNFQTSTLDLN